MFGTGFGNIHFLVSRTRVGKMNTKMNTCFLVSDPVFYSSRHFGTDPTLKKVKKGSTVELVYFSDPIISPVF